jgi:hypothetical protein
MPMLIRRPMGYSLANAQTVGFSAQMQPGDLCIMYDTGDERSVAGVAQRLPRQPI